MLITGVTEKCLQKMKENQTVCASSAFLKDTGMKSTKKGVKDTRPAKKAANARAAARS